jgi:hypothetical protein
VAGAVVWLAALAGAVISIVIAVPQIQLSVAAGSAPDCVRQTTDSTCVLAGPASVVGHYTQKVGSAGENPNYYLQVIPDTSFQEEDLQVDAVPYQAIPVNATITVGTYQGHAVYVAWKGARYDVENGAVGAPAAPLGLGLVAALVAAGLTFSGWTQLRGGRPFPPAGRALRIFVWVLIPIGFLLVPVAFLASSGKYVLLGALIFDVILCLLLHRRWRSRAAAASA